MSEYSWINGELTPIQQANISVLDHGVLYGDGIFEGMRVYHNKVFKLYEHLERLMASAKALHIAVPYSVDELSDACNGLIEKNALSNGYIRLLVTRGEGSLGLNPKNCHTSNVIILYRELQMMDNKILQTGANLITASYRRTPIDVINPKIKSLNYVNNILAKIEANNAGADDAILLNHQGYITEATAANVFIVKNNTLITPSTEVEILEGITRNTIIELAEQSGIKVLEKKITTFDFYSADEAFLTGSGAELIPVKQLDARVLNNSPGPVYQSLLSAFQAAVLAY